MKTSKLEELRQSLEDVNSEFFSLLARRQKLVNQIQELKKSEDVWDPRREYALFSRYCYENTHFDLKQDFLFSYLIESQAQASGRYPAWSCGEHLHKVKQGLNYQLNPILLWLRDRKTYCELALNAEYEKKLGEILTDEK